METLSLGEQTAGKIQESRRMLGRSRYASAGMSLDLASFLGGRQQQIVSKRLTMCQKICYHKKEKIDEVVRVGLPLPPDNPTQALTRLEATPDRNQSSGWVLGKSLSIRSRLLSYRFIVFRSGGSRGRETAREKILLR